MATKFATEWGAVYNKATIVFSNEIKAAKKADKGKAAVLTEILEGPQNSSGILGCMVAFDKVNLAHGNPKEIAAFPANLKAAKAVMAKFAAEHKKYVKTIDEALSMPMAYNEQGFKVTRPLKDVCPETYRQLKILKTQIDAFVNQAASALAAAENVNKTDKIGEQGNKEKDKIKGSGPEANAALKAISEEIALKKHLVTFSTQFKAAMGKGAAVIQKLKGSPDLATYNDLMNTGGRDISQQVVNFAKVKANPKLKNLSIVKKIPDPGPIAAHIAEFGDGAKRKLPDNTSPEVVKERIAEFTALFKQIASTYKDILSGKLK